MEPRCLVTLNHLLASGRNLGCAAPTLTNVRVAVGDPKVRRKDLMFIVERIYMAIAMLQDRRQDDEKGASMVEYALLVAGMALVVAAAVTLFGTRITAIINSIDIPA